MTATITGYQSNEIIFENERTQIRRGIRTADNTPVVIKLSSAQYPTHFELARLKHEYEVLGRLAITGVSRAYALEKTQNGLALILEDFAGQPLSDCIGTAHLDLATFLEYAVKMATIVGAMHDCGVIHKDLNPRNFLLNRATAEFRIIDFGLSSVLQRQEQEAISPGLLEGSLPYMSPEQTGRMNRGIDYRSDYYSLGIVFYELLTGKHPFHAEDSIGWVHCHIAKTPPSLCEQRADLPPVIDSIV